MKKEIHNVIFIITAIIIILFLAFLFYIFSAKEVSLNNKNIASLSESVKVFSSEHTQVINFAPSEVLPNEIKEGDCWTNSIAEPFRKDAWRCAVENEIYDPCFETLQKDIIFCQMNPLVPSAFLIELEKPLPEASLPKDRPDNWAWFVKLKDGTYCSPFTGTRPVFGEASDVKIAYYGCRSNNKDEQIVLLGDLIKADVWTAQKASLEKNTEDWVIKSIDSVKIDTVWQ